MSARSRTCTILILWMLAHPFGGCAESEGDARQAEPTGIASWIERGPLRVHVAVDRDELHVAESLTLTIEASVSDGYVLDLPRLGDRKHSGDVSLAPLRITDERRQGTHMDDGGRIRESLVLTLEPYLPGEFEIPALTFHARPIEHPGAGEAIEATTRPIAITVRSLLTSDELVLPQMRDVVDPAYDFEVPVGGVVAALVIAAGLLAGIVLIGRRLIMEPLPPSTIDEARERLDVLARRSLDEEDERRETLLEASSLLRACLATRTDRRATRMSERELRRLIRSRHTLDTHEQLALTGLIRELDEAVFGGGQTEAEQARALIRSVIEQLPVIERCGLHFAAEPEENRQEDPSTRTRRRLGALPRRKDRDA